MQTIINWTKSPVVLTDDDDKRLTLHPGKSLSFNGDLTGHPWVKKGYLEIGTSSLDAAHGEDGGDGGEGGEEIESIRQRYQNIYGEKPHANTSKATLLKKIEEWQSQAD